MLASEMTLMLSLRYLYFLFFYNKNDRPKTLGEKNPSAILRYCGSYCVFLPSLINCLNIQKRGEEVCRALNVPHFSTAAKTPDFQDVWLCESLHIINVFWKLSLKLFKS